MNDRQFRRHARHLVLAWAALIALMLASLGSSYLPLGIANGLIGAGIAIAKSSIVLALFMGLWGSGALLRIVGATALGTWCLLLALGGLDQTERAHERSVVQPAQQVPSTFREQR